MEIQYLGEELVFGKIGNLLIALAFTGALLSGVSYYFSFKRIGEESSWKKLARASYFLHAFSVFGILGLIYYLIFNHRFEYYYVWQHSSTTLPWKYISSFWEGQEGSFLLWTFWHVILSFFIIKKGGTWKVL